MVVTYNDEVLRLVVSQICQNVGWNGIGNQSLDILKEVCRKYIQEIGKVTSAVCNHYNRTEPNLDDLAIAFKQFDISIPELEDYYGNVDPVQFAKGEVPRIPVPNARGCSRITFTDESEIQTRAEYYNEWLPSLQTLVDTTIREGLESVTLNETEEPASELAAAKRAQGKREDAIGAVKTAPSLKVSGFSELEATQPTSVYIASNGQIVGVNGREGRHPEAKLPPKDYDEEDLFDRVCRGHYDKQHSFNDVNDEQRVREKQIPSPLKLKLKDKKRLKKNKENSIRN
ncbi:hypothetical protein B4U80_05839 [Leptotrombidium deliense]|uniref:Bromodomain associated domain-containing protein n=1 Tax=Leptotrombidium deliense TaxID=299467 RepID=A0A443SLG2_9ACAR|nr:hypothetical protein B4U80_05839 [Leptotrombidium deliense]